MAGGLRNLVCFDTTFLVDYLRERRAGDKGPAVKMLDRLEQTDEISRTTIITVSELYYGAFYKGTKAGLERTDSILANLDILPFSYTAAKRAGNIAAQLKKAGRSIGMSDIFIASIVLEANETVLTRNVGHFSRIHGLKVEVY